MPTDSYRMHMCNDDMCLNRVSFRSRLYELARDAVVPAKFGRRLSIAASRVLSPLPLASTVSGPVGRQSGAMKLVKASQDITIPDDIKLEVKSRKIRVTGPRGTLTRDFKHLAVDMYKTHDQVENDEGEMVEGPLKLRVDCHFGKRKRLAAIRTCTSHVQNMIKGVTKGFEYKMRLVYAHFPINANITDEGSCIEVRNFLGEKRVRIVNMLPGVKIVRSTNVKDELVISGSDIELVSKSAALINMSCHVKKKDIRKFLDGVYVSEKTTIVKDE